MIDPDRRNAIYQLHLAGDASGARSAGNSTSARTRCGRSSASREPCPRRCGKTRSTSTRSLLRRLYQQCDGWIQRVHEILVEDERVQRQLSHLDAAGAGVGVGQALEGPLRSRAGRTGRGDAARHHGVPR